MDVTEAKRETKDILFRRIGVDLTLHDGTAGFEDGIVPVRGLEVANKFGITFVVYPGGFIVRETSGLVRMALQAKDGRSSTKVQQGDYVDVQVPGVYILSLSRDELTLAACVSEGTVRFYDVPTLFKELDNIPLESRDIPECHIKDFRWGPADDTYLILSREGQLFSGRVGETPSRLVNSDAVAVSWSPDGKHVAYLTQGGAVCVTNSRVELQHSFELPSQLGDLTENLHVESVEWIRLDAMLVSYTQTNEDGEDEECPLILVTSREGDFTKKDGTITAVSFDNTFPSIDSRVLPPASGPYMLAKYIEPWDMVIAASRRSVDDHIVTLGLPSENHEAISFELSNDTWLPRIELQENGDDNILLGLSVVTTTTDLQEADPRDDSGDTKLPACPVLMCLSLGGKLSLFLVARLDKNSLAMEFISPPSKLPKVTRSKSKSKSSGDIALEASQQSANIEIPVSQHAESKQTREGTEDEPSVISGSDANRENDGNDNDEILSRLPASGRYGKLSEALKKGPLLKGEGSLLSKETPSMPSLQTAGSSALISLGSAGTSDISHLSTVKGAPSDIGQTQQTGPTNQPPSLLTRTVPEVQSATSQTSLLSHLINSQSFSSGLFGSVGNGESTRQPTPPFQGTPPASSSFGNIRPSVQFTPTSQGPLASNLKAPESSGLFGSMGNGKGALKGLQKTNSSGARTLSGSSAKQSGVSEPEQAFYDQLEQIRRMGGELDNLMAYIEGRGEKTSGNHPPCFTKNSLNELELELRNLADNCKTAKERVEAQRQSLNNLRDENLQLEAWRLYIRSKTEQAGDNRHQELWIRRKLTPDLDVKRKRVTKAEQALKQQIAALEEHIHHLELDNRKRVVSQKGGVNINRQTSAGRSQSVQNLYSTVNGLLASADRLSQQVAQQMEVLHISAQPRTAQKIMLSVGLPSDGTSHVQTRPTFSGTVPSPLARQQSFHSPCIKAELGLPIHTTPPRRTIPSDSGVGAPSITRRRRDSMDGVQKALALAGGASPKTMIERVSHHTPSHQPNASKQYVRQRSFQESSEKISSHPRHVRRVLSSQAQSATSSSAPSILSVPKNKASSIPIGFSENSAVTNLEGSQASPFMSEREPRDIRPDSKSAVPRNSSSIAEKSVPTLTSRFGPPPGRTSSSPTSVVSTSSNVGVSYSTGSLSSNTSSESVFKLTNSNPSNPAPSFSFATAPSFAKPTGTSGTSGSMSFGKQVSNTSSSNEGATVSLPTLSSSAIGSATSNATTGVSATTKLGIGSTKSGSGFNSKPSVDSEKEDKPNFGFKPPSFGIPAFGTSSFKPVATPSSAIASPAVTSASFVPQVSISGTVLTNPSPSQVLGNHPPSSPNESASPTLDQAPSAKGSMLFGQTFTPTSTSQTPFVFPAASPPTATFSVPPITTPESDEEDMDEEQGTGGTSVGGFNLEGLGLGSCSTAQPQAPKPSLFGNSVPFGTQQTSSGFGMSSPQGQLFRPPSFSLPSAQSPPQTNVGFGFGHPTTSQAGSSPFGTAFGSTTSNPPSVNPFGTTPAGSATAFGSPAPPGAGGFGQPSQVGPGQKALGSALGTFGQTRQMGFGSTTPFGSTLSAGFGSTPSGGGLGSAATIGGFASAATGGGFASAATGGGFASAATGGGFTSASGASGGGFAGVTGGGFQAFGGGGQPAFSSSSPSAPSLFTQMRK